MQTVLKHPFAHKLGAAFCVVVMLVCAMVTPVSAQNTNGNSNSETAAQRYARLKGELADITAEIERLEGDITAAEGQRALLVEQRAYYEELIALKTAEIETTQAALEAKEEEIAIMRQTILEEDELFQSRMVAIYRMNTGGTLSSLLSVSSFSELLTVIDAMQRISQNDTQLLESLSSQRVELEEQQAEIDGILSQLEEDYAELADMVSGLTTNISAYDANISAAQASLEAQETAYDVTYEEYEQAYQDMLAASRASYSQGSSYGDGSEYIGGVFIWPVPASYRITCHFGAPDPNGNGHLGMDIGAASGSSILAAGSGTVITSTFHPSYGYYIVIDHGNGTKTLYAHCSALYVGVGAFVSTGDTIAAVGSTGFSTGPHLHFEVQAAGGRQNPLNYLRG